MYTAEINRKQPALLFLLIDESFSMIETWGDTAQSKADVLATAVNNLLANAVVLCTRGDDRVHNYFDVGVLGYGAEVRSLLHGADDAELILPIETVAKHPKRVDTVQKKEYDGAGGVLTVDHVMPIWVDASANGRTPMVAAFATAEAVIEQWCIDHPDSFPPIVMNVTDGHSTDGDPGEITDRIKAIGTSDGKALVFNLHLSGAGVPVSFPSTDTALPDENARMLFRSSSELPPTMLEAAAAGYPVQAGSRGFLYNAPATTVIDFLDIGTRSVTPQRIHEPNDTSDASRALADTSNFEDDSAFPSAR
ncbi:vWA domain-containing protein [Nocardia rhamnosiphila]|uniref:VWA domain-containing protein n=1 Tax=Nocardia rhamnosiphila TaxID=426716 RepID=A0ABV2WWJ2_9NOCA